MARSDGELRCRAEQRTRNADRELVRIVDAAVLEAERKGGAWVVCRPGCTPCCLGPFGITQVDAIRLREGLRTLAVDVPDRARQVRLRAAGYVAAIGSDYPGDHATGVLDDEDRLPPEFDDVPCPALDPATGRCDLYDSRPLTCRLFGPAIRSRDGDVAACELCYEGVPPDEIVRCAVNVDAESLEAALLDELEANGLRGLTIVAFALTN
ncbi:MAG: YkgJ family cysteine cluster protein [Bryobacteraceae bacterium]|nr:YkgJ family cysteine cluster protein [Bryobacteraceae bacterium]